MANEKAPVAPAADEEEIVTEAQEKVEGKEPVEPVEEPEEGAEAVDDEGEEGKKTESEDDGEKKLSKSARKNAKIRARIESLEEIARLESARADREAAARKALTDDLGPEPKKEDFADPEQFVAELAAYRAEARALARQKKTSEATVTDSRQAANVAKYNLFHERALALVDRFPDIQARVFDDATAPISPVMAEVIQDSDRGPEVAYYLATHREEALRITKMAPLAVAKELGRIEATLDAPKPRTQSKAPPPPEIVKGTKSTAAIVDWDKQPIEKWLEHRNLELGIGVKRN